MSIKILDATCGNRGIWFNKDEPHTVYCDNRREEYDGDFGNVLRMDGSKKHRHIVVNPDICCSFTHLPFENDTFSLVVFDPPHVETCQKKHGCVRCTALWTAIGNR